MGKLVKNITNLSILNKGANGRYDFVVNLPIEGAILGDHILFDTLRNAINSIIRNVGDGFS